MPDLSWIDWGSAPAWGALVAGTAAAVLAGRNVWHDRQDRQQQQARKVAAWWGMFESRPGPMQRRSSGAWLLNASEVPVYDVDVEWLYDSRVIGTHSRRVLPPAEREFAYLLKRYESGDAEAEERHRKTLEVVAKVDDGLDVRLSFRDAAGRRWTRSENGRLARTDRRLGPAAEF